LDDSTKSISSSTRLASELRRVMEESEATLAEGGLASAFAASRQHTGLLFTDTLAADLGRLLDA